MSALSLAFAGCVLPPFDPTGKGCDDAHLCPMEFVCVSGACTPGRVPCSFDEDCLSGEACAAGACRACGGEVPCPSVCYPDVVLADAPMLYWRLGERDGGTVRDASKHGLDGSHLKGVAEGVPGAIAGDPDTAMSFDGGFVQATTLVAVDEDFTTEVWFKGRPGSSGHITGVFLHDNGFPIRAIGIDGEVFDTQTMLDSEWPQYTISSPRVDTTTWHHVVATVQGTTELTLFVDGSAVMHRTVAPTATFSGTPIVGWSGAPWDRVLNSGTVDEFAIYGRALPANRVLRHFQVAGARSRLEAGQACCRDAECASGSCIGHLCIGS